MIRIHDVCAQNTGAQSPEDYQHQSQLVSLSSSSRSQCVAIPIVHDTIIENTESFSAVLYREASLPSYVDLSPSTSTIRILHVSSKFKLLWYRTILQKDPIPHNRAYHWI